MNNPIIERLSSAWASTPRYAAVSSEGLTLARWVVAPKRQDAMHVADSVFDNVHLITMQVRGFTGECYVDGKQFCTGRVSANRVRILPAGHSAAWRSEKVVEMFHVYVPDALLRRRLSLLGKPVGRGQPCLRTTQYVSDVLLQSVMQRLASLNTSCNPVKEAYQAALRETLISHLLANYGHDRAVSSDGGNSPVDTAHKLMSVLSQSVASRHSIAELADMAGMDARRFNADVRKITGLTPHQYRLQLRIMAAKNKLDRGAQSLSEIADELGFADQAHFTRTFRRYEKCTPGQYSASSRGSLMTQVCGEANR